MYCPEHHWPCRELCGVAAEEETEIIGHLREGLLIGHHDHDVIRQLIVWENERHIREKVFLLATMTMM